MIIARSRILACALVSVVSFASASPALAATKNGITPLSPKSGGKVAKGKSATFRMRVSGPGKVFVHVCKSAKKSKKEGTICFKVTIGQATRHNGVYSFKQRYYDYPAFWLNTPGTYYWQAHRISCERGSITDCRQEGPVVKFRVA